MARKHENMMVFQQADELVLEVYKLTKDLPAEERFGLQSQIRRAAVSAPTNIVEGAARDTDKDFRHFLVMALGSASEVKYLLALCSRLELLDSHLTHVLESRYDSLIRSLQCFIDKLKV